VPDSTSTLTCESTSIRILPATETSSATNSSQVVFGRSIPILLVNVCLLMKLYHMPSHR
jgi:hypothetical protein